MGSTTVQRQKLRAELLTHLTVKKEHLWGTSQKSSLVAAAAAVATSCVLLWSQSYKQLRMRVCVCVCVCARRSEQVRGGCNDMWLMLQLVVNLCAPFLLS